MSHAETRDLGEGARAADREVCQCVSKPLGQEISEKVHYSLSTRLHTQSPRRQAYTRSLYHSVLSLSLSLSLSLYYKFVTLSLSMRKVLHTLSI